MNLFSFKKVFQVWLSATVGVCYGPPAPPLPLTPDLCTSSLRADIIVFPPSNDKQSGWVTWRNSIVVHCEFSRDF